MTVVGVGIDVCAIVRVEGVLAEHGDRFAERVMTPAERGEGKVDAAKLARRWAMKEAVAKALGTGIGADYGFHDIEIGHDARGAPVATVAKLPTGMKVFVSVSDDAGLAVAYAVVERA